MCELLFYLPLMQISVPVALVNSHLNPIVGLSCCRPPLLYIIAEITRRCCSMVLALYSFVHLMLTGPCSHLSIGGHYADQSRQVVDASEIRLACKDGYYQQLHLASNSICICLGKEVAG
jgi:hypothetical protein